jgi:hypothetical protein
VHRLMIWKVKSFYRNLCILSISHLMKHIDHDIENIYDLLHIGKHKWDVSCFHFDGDSIYDTNENSRVKSPKLLPLEQPSFSKNFMITFSHICTLIMQIFGNMKRMCS